MKHNPLILTFAAAMGVVALSAGAETLCAGVSEPVRVDQTAGTRKAQATETIVYSPKWYAAEGGLTATVKIDGGDTLVDAATAGGTYAWSTPTKPGTYTLKHETYQDGTLKETLTATFEKPQRKPDYADKTGKDWLFHHDILAKRCEGEPAQDPGVDLFFVIPTAAKTNSATTVNGFVDLDEPQMREGASAEFDKTGRVFADFTHVYAPFYRQATMEKAKAVVAAHPDWPNEAYAEALYDSVAYADITNALTYYFTKINPDGKRPFIFASHSQGSALLRNVVVHFFPGHKAWLDNLVACYAIGYGVDADWAYVTVKETGLTPAQDATSTKVYVTWNTEGERPAECGTSILMPTNRCCGVNPITWKLTAAESVADKTMNFGALTNVNKGSVVAHLYGATNFVSNGAIVCLDCKDFEKETALFGSQSLHEKDYTLYWENIRDNAYARIETATGKRPACGTPTDYAKAENWMVKPETADKAVDVFFLYPTTDTGKTPNLVAEIDDAMKATAWDAYQQDTMGFWSYANMYAPYYRQASMLGLQAQAGVSGLKNFCSTHVVKTDVFAALDYYFTNLNDKATRPYILVGHSQGSCNIKVVLEEYMKDHADYKKKLVAAYAMGFAVESSWCKKADVQFAESESDTGVILTWNCEGPDATHGSVNFLTEPDDGQAINPLNWKTDDTYAPIKLNLGSVVKNAKGEYEWGKGNADAQLSPKEESPYGFRPGALVVTNTTAAYSPEILGYQSYHGNDGAFFQRNVGNNGFKRYAAFAGLVEVVTNDVPQVADATWKVMADGAEATLSPVDGLYYASAAAQEVKLVYTISGEATSRRFINGETTTSFPMKKEGGVWVSTATEAEIKAATKTGEPSVQLGVVAQRYPWNGTLDIQYRLQFEKEAEATLKVTANGVEKTEDVTLANGKNTLAFDMKKAFGEIKAKEVKVTLKLK